ncbi:MAG: ATP-dependent endonuclease [Rhodospirillales bacterium]
MIIESIRIRNFRSIRDQKIECEKLTTIVGPNGSGKSTFLKALDYFYSPSSQCKDLDFFNKKCDQDIEIEVVFCDLSHDEVRRFSKYLQDGKLAVTKIYPAGGGKVGGKYFGARLQHPLFQGARKSKGRELISHYNELKKNVPDFEALPAVRSADDALNAMEEWENEHPNSLEMMRDDGQFFGFTHVGGGRLSKGTKFVLIPGVRDASDEISDSKNTVISELMDLLVRSRIQTSEELEQLKIDTLGKFEEITSPAKVPALGQLAARLTSSLSGYYDDTGIHLDWDRGDEIGFPSLKANVGVIDQGMTVPVGYTGHGLQRAIIIALLQALASIQYELGDSESDSGSREEPLDLILAIEEPELYQHPSQQRKFARILAELSNQDMVREAPTSQVIFTTHSPLMVGIDTFNQIRRVCRVKEDPEIPPDTRVQSSSWGDVAQRLQIISELPEATFNEASLKPRIQTLMTPWMNEGFFSKYVVLVEGEGDRAALLGLAFSRDHDLESMGFSVIPCGGKTNIDKAAVIFRCLGIPIYLIWDGDKQKQESPQANRALLRLLGKDPIDWPTTTVSEEYSCFEDELETQLRSDIGDDLFDRLLGEEANKIEMRISDARKRPLVLAKIVRRAEEQGASPRTLAGILDRLLAIRAA